MKPRQAGFRNHSTRTMSIFNRIFGTKKFPGEHNRGKVEIAGNRVVCADDKGVYSCQVNLDDLQYAYVAVDRNGQSLLFLFDHHQNFIPATFSGFKNVYAELSRRFGFNDQVFFQHVNRGVELKREIWRRQYEPTYEILKEDHEDYAGGFEIQSPQKQFISWDTPLEELEQCVDIIFKKSAYGHEISGFRYPVRIGSLLLKNFHSYFDQGRRDMPVLHFYSHCFCSRGTDKSYRDLKHTLERSRSLADCGYGYERADQRSISFDMGGMQLTIFYTYDSDGQFNSGYTSLSVENKRDYPALLIDPEYEARMVVSSFLVLDGETGIGEDYKRNSRVKRRMPGLGGELKNRALIWMDDVNGKIGFAGGAFAMVYDKEEIGAFCIQNILPAKGPGGAYLELVLENRQRYAVFSAHCHFFDQYAEKIRHLTGMELSFGREEADC